MSLKIFSFRVKTVSLNVPLMSVMPRKPEKYKCSFPGILGGFDVYVVKLKSIQFHVGRKTRLAVAKIVRLP